MKAWRVTLIDRYDEGGICAAPTRASARHVCLAAAHEAGFTSVRYGDFQVLRAPEYDGWAIRQPRRIYCTEDYVRAESS